ncbi:MAG: hypothetical protein QOF70_4014 [Acetobacteraceae bacterium]|nr:hypothetical protein [Rhodopila sp.]MEA2729539.1 hypothetical protein [Acetobacteraceae bacterium]
MEWMNRSMRLHDVRKALTDPESDALSAPGDYAAGEDYRGAYIPTRFFIKLAPRIHELVDAITRRDTDSYDADELISAYSTYLHETIHWWQFVGSTAGLIMSLCYPAQCTANIEALRAVIQKHGPKKSLKAWAQETLIAGGPAVDAELGDANKAVNNAIDINFYRTFATFPIRAPEIFEDPYFECVGHSYTVAYINTIHALIISCDFAAGSLPDPDEWEKHAEALRAAEHEGFYHGSPIRRARVGLCDIFEGQARFSQLQFLCGMSGPAECAYYRDEGYFEGCYGAAFDHFLELTGFTWPDRIDDPLVALFLLVCDLAINPTRGFPLPIISPKDLIVDIDPGARFTHLCEAAKHDPGLAGAIQRRSREEYIAVAEALTQSCGYDHPMLALKTIVDLIDNDVGAGTLMQEWETFRFSGFNQPIRVIASHFLAFCRDKFEHPEFFCWPGVYCAAEGKTQAYEEIFLRHLTLYSDSEYEGRVFPRQLPGREQAAVQETLNIFFTTLLLYDLTVQWILNGGPFRYDYSWLTGTYKNDALVTYAKTMFERNFGAHPDAFEGETGAPP